MKRFRSTTFMLFLGVVIIRCHLGAQIQPVWIDTVWHGSNGNIESIHESQGNKLYVAIDTQDTICGYSMVRAMSYSSAGTLMLDTALFNDVSCVQENYNSCFVDGGDLWLNYYDTLRVVTQLNSTGPLMNFSSGVIVECKPDINHLIGYQPPVKKNVKLTTTGIITNVDSLPYSVTCSIADMQLSSNVSLYSIFNFIDSSANDMLGVGVRVLDQQFNFLGDTLLNDQSTIYNSDYYIGSAVTETDHLLLLNGPGAYLYKINLSGNVVATYESGLFPWAVEQLMYDPVSHLIYISGRLTTDNVIMVLDSSLNCIDTIFNSSQLARPSEIAVTPDGDLLHLWYWRQGTQKTLRLDVYNNAQIRIDSFLFWDSTLYSFMMPGRIAADSNGLIYFTTDGNNTSNIEFSMVYCLDRNLSITTPSSSQSIPLTVFPNPTNSMVTINFDTGVGSKSVSIFSSSGQLISSTITRLGVLTIDVSALPPGAYIVKVTDDNENEGRKLFIKQ
ncbi:MAG: T9SS type A sorting domain-containing protein [Bacteroidia bacterium]|nr:T9SS type A sorting domain-containing protein [Bacteroidia bacterium]